MLRRIWQTAGPRRKLVLYSGLLLILASVFSILPFFFIYKLLSELFRTAPGYALAGRFLIFILASYALAYVFLFLGYHVSHETAYRILSDLRVELAEKLLRIPLGYFNRTTTGAIAGTLNENVEKLELFLAHHFPEMMPVFFVPIGLLVLLFAIDKRMALAAILPVVFGVVLVLLSRRGWHRMVVANLKARDRMYAVIIEYIQGIKVIKTFNLAEESRKRFARSMTEWARHCIVWSEKTAPPLTIYQAIVTSTLVFIIPVGFWLQSHRLLGKGQLLFFLVMGTLFGKVFLRIYSVLRYTNEEAHCMERINAIRQLEPLALHEPVISPSDNSVTFRDVWFCYDRVPILKGVSFHIEEGQKVALVGPSGAGKSTIARLLPRFWDVEKGAVLIGNADVRQIPPEALMARTSLVFQDVFLFNDSIYENIRLGRPDATREDIEAAAKAACCAGFISELPQGYDTRAGDLGTRLSGGEKQRISIARAILKDAPILVLDEATATVDPENELAIQRALTRLAAKKTVLIIAHRLSTIANVDRILVLNEGQIVEEGTFPELTGRKGRFAEMWQAFERNLSWRVRA